jgi:hypothetical protein
MKRTPWFSALVNPVREGEYECRIARVYPIGWYLGRTVRLRWTGRSWSNGMMCSNFDVWRGLAERPE